MKFLHQPYPFTHGWRTSLATALGFGAFVTLFLLVFRPFGLSQLEEGIAMYSLCFGLVTFCSILVIQLPLNVIPPRGYFEDRWTVGLEIMEIMGIVLVIAAGNFTLATYFGFFGPTVGAFFLFITFTLSIGIFPVTVAVMLRQVKLARERAKQSEIINKDITGESAGAGQGDIHFADDEGRPCISIPGGDVLFISAADNYVEVYYLEDQQVRKALIRNTLKNMEEVLASQPGFFRCHRSFLVNLQRIQKVQGNARGYLLYLHASAPSIPVSRTRIAAFDRVMTAAWLPARPS